MCMRDHYEGIYIYTCTYIHMYRYAYSFINTHIYTHGQVKDLTMYMRDHYEGWRCIFIHTLTQQHTHTQVKDLMMHMRDHYEGSILNMTEDVGSGAWCVAICCSVFRCVTVALSET